VLDADYRPPARRGDLAQAAAEGARRIVLIDGLLVYAYPPSPSEIAEVMEQGVEVHGAASLGALRAVELRFCGMMGIGWVYKCYLYVTVDSDDEVVTPLSPQDHRPLTVALVRVRYALSRLAAEGLVSPSQAAAVIDHLRHCYFEERTAARVLSVAVACGIAPAVASRLLEDEFDIKAIDTLRCLVTLRHDPCGA
jgi:hypothetical protein